MRKIAVIILILLPIFLNAQNNSFKFTLSPSMFATNNLGLNYERKLGNALSGSLKLNYSAKNSVPLNGVAQQVLGDMIDSAGIGSNLLSRKIISYGIGLQFKYFPGKSSMEGFYFAPYFGYQVGFLEPFKVDFADANDSKIKHEGEVNVNFAFLGGGVGIGNQWIFGNGLTFDVLWLGIGGGFNNIKIIGTDNSGGQVDHAESKAEVDEFLVGKDKFSYEFGFQFISSGSNAKIEVEADYTTLSTNEQIEIIAKHAFPYMKFLNFSIGYSF